MSSWQKPTILLLYFNLIDKILLVTRNDSPFLSSYQLTVVLQLAMGFNVHFFSPWWHLVWHEHIQALWMLSQLLWVHIFNYTVVSRIHYLFILIYYPCILHSFCPLFNNDPWALWRGWIIGTSHLQLNILKYLILVFTDKYNCFLNAIKEKYPNITDSLIFDVWSLLMHTVLSNKASCSLFDNWYSSGLWYSNDYVHD